MKLMIPYKFRILLTKNNRISISDATQISFTYKKTFNKREQNIFLFFTSWYNLSNILQCFIYLISLPKESRDALRIVICANLLKVVNRKVLLILLLLMILN